MHDRRQIHALPRAPVDGPQEAGLRVVPTPADTGIRCTTPGCRRKLAEALQGSLTIQCDRCKQTVTITR